MTTISQQHFGIAFIGEFKACERQSVAPTDGHHPAAINYWPPCPRPGMAPSRRATLDLQEIFGHSGFSLTTLVCLGRCK
jgi:hypothetical protein